jgi:hypothetical protein
MGFGLYWFEEEDIKDAEKDFSSNLADDLEDALEKKAKEIKWKNSISELNKRFHNTFKIGGLHVAEISFPLCLQVIEPYV